MTLQEKIKGFTTKKHIKTLLYVLGTLFILCAILQFGIFIGYHKASFARDWGDGYKENFGMERPESFKGMMRNRLPTAYGASGKILSVTLPTFIVEDSNGTEKTIYVSTSTLIKSAMQDASSSVITVDAIVMVIGDPNTNGQIEAKLVRIMPTGALNASSTRGMMRGNSIRGWGMMFQR